MFGKIRGALSEDGITKISEDMFQANKTGRNQMMKFYRIVMYKALYR